MIYEDKKPVRERVYRRRKSKEPKKLRHKQGVIILFNRLGRKLVERRYSDVTGRRNIISRWKIDYREGFKSYFYHIVPDEITNEF